MNRSFKKTISAVVAFILSASCFANMAFADSKLAITGATVADGKISGITVDGVAEGTKGKGIVAVYTKTGAIKEIAFTETDVTAAGDVKLSKELAYSEADGDTYKVFVWEVENGKVVPKPLTEAYKYGPVSTETPAATATTGTGTTNPTPTATTGTGTTNPTPTATTGTGTTNPTPTATTGTGTTNPTPTATTGTGTTNPTPTATTSTGTTTATASPATVPTVAPTAEPVKTYTITGTVDAGVDSVKLTPATGDAINGQIEGTTVTFTGVKAGTYDIEVTAKTGKGVLSIKNGADDITKVTVTDADITGAFTVVTSGESKLTFAQPTEELFGKTAADLGTFEYTETAVTGTAKYVSDYTGFSSTAAETYGHYLPITVSVPADLADPTKAVVTYSTDSKQSSEKTFSGFTSNDRALSVVFILNDDTTKLNFTVDFDGDGTEYAPQTYEINISGVVKADPTLPELTGVVLAENDFSTDDTWGFTTGRSGQAPKVTDGKLVLTNGNNSSDNVQNKDEKVFGADVTASKDVEVMFDYNPQIDTSRNRWSTLSLTDSSDNVIISLASMGNAGIGYLVGDRAVFDNNALKEPATKIANNGGSSNVLRVYVHFVNNTVSGYIFDVSGDTPKFVAAIPTTTITATNVGKLVAQEGYSVAPQAIDNVKITTADTDVKAVTVTAPNAADGTLEVSQKVARQGDVITITPNAASGKKVTAVKVNDTPIAYAEGYSYTVTGSEESIVVSAEFARADVTGITIDSTNANVQKGYTGAYTAIVTATKTDADDTTLTGDDAVVTWNIKASEEGGVSSIAAGTKIDVDPTDGNKVTLTVDAAQEEGKIDVIATIKKDITDVLSEEVTQTFVVTIVGEPVYQLASAELTNGTVAFTVGEDTEATSVKKSASVKIVPTAATGYAVDTVSYQPTSNLSATPTVVADSGDGYVIAENTLTEDITVTVTFKAIEYTITNNSSEDDGNGNSIAVNISDAAATKGTIGQTVTIVPTIANGYKLATLKYNDGADHDILTAKSFTMPASEVTVTATFEEIPGVTYENDFSANDLTALADFSGATKVPSGYSWVMSGRIGTADISTNYGKFTWTASAGKSDGTYNDAYYGVIKSSLGIADATAAYNYTVSFDWSPVMYNANGHNVMELIDADKNVVLGLDLASTSGNGGSLKYYTGGKCAYKVYDETGVDKKVQFDGKNILDRMVGANYANAVEFDTFTGTDGFNYSSINTTYTVTLTVNPLTGEGTITIADGSGNTKVDAAKITVGAKTGLSDIYFGALNATNGTSTGAIVLDNLSIKTNKS
jgi:hypothetical protein